MILQYIAVTRNGEKIRGEFVGSKEELVRYLQHDGIVLLSVTESKRKLKKGKYRIDDFASDIEELSYLVGSGLPIDKAIASLMKNLKKEEAVELWESVLSGLREGKQLSVAIKSALKRKGLSIGNFYLNIISVGEEVGNVESALKDVSAHLQFRLGMKRDTISALAYPAFLVAVSILALFFIAYFILPRFASIFTPKDLQNVPAISRIFLSFGQFIHSNASAVFVLFVSAVVLVVFLFSFEKPKRLVVELFQRLPFVRDIVMELHIANLCSSIGAMLKGGVDIAQAMRLAGDITTHRGLKNIIKETAEGLKSGLKISEMWARYSLIPDDVISLVAVGESSATLDEVFEKLGKRHLENFKTKVSKAMTFLEPAMIVILGVFIGMIVVSIMLAVLSLTNVS